jgi:DNA repair exonuclease SbcCD ATPase subunit
LLSEKAELLKEQTKETKDLIVQETASIEATKKSNEKIQQSVDSLLTKQIVWGKQHQQEIEKIARAIVELENVDIEAELAKHAALKAYLEKSAKLKSLEKERATLDSAIAQAERSVTKYDRELGLLADKKCHACEQELHDHKHTELSSLAKHHLDEAEAFKNKLMNDWKKVHDEITELGEVTERPNTYYDTVEEALKHQNTIQTLETQLEIKTGETDPYQEQIEELRMTAMQTISWDKVNELTSLKDHQEFLLKLLTSKDSFIRKKIIDQNLAYLNNRLTYYLDKMGLPHTVAFQNDLSVIITQLGQDLDFDNLSRGERNRLILSLSWAFRDVWESLYQQINLLFVDELIDNGLDASGVEGALAVLKKMGRERKKNIFLISHKDELIGRVNNVLKVVKENGFTSYATDLEINE